MELTEREAAMPPDGHVLIRQAEIDDGFLFLIEPGIIVFNFRPGVAIEEPNAWAHFEGMEAIGDGWRCPVAVRINSARVSPSARRVYASEHAVRVYPAIALVAESRVSVMLANFFLRVSRPQVLARMFQTMPQGLAWLEDHVMPPPATPR